MRWMSFGMKLKSSNFDKSNTKFKHMKIIKYLLGFIVLLIVVTLIYASTLEKSKLVEQSITINKPSTEIFNYIKLYKNQLKYSVWSEMDPNTKREFSGTDGQLGSIHKWESEHEQVGYGSMELTKIEEDKRLEWNLIFTKPFQAQSTPYMNTNMLDSNSTQVVWGCDMTIPFPFNIFLEDESEKLSNQFATSLDKLKSILEN